MNIITKQRDENLKNFNPFKIIFCKYKDKNEEEKQVIISNKTETVIDFPKNSIQPVEKEYLRILIKLREEFYNVQKIIIQKNLLQRILNHIV